MSYSPLLAAALLPASACSSARPTSSGEVKATLARCGIAESELLWMIDDKGSFLFGRAGADAPGPAPAKVECLTDWLDKENIRTGGIGYGVPV